MRERVGQIERKSDRATTQACIIFTGRHVSAGIEPTGNCIGAPARFTVETFSAGRGQVEVIIINPKGAQEKVTVFDMLVYVDK